MKQQGPPQILVEMDEGIKEIRQLLLEDVDRQAYENALLKNTRMQKPLKKCVKPLQITIY